MLAYFITKRKKRKQCNSQYFKVSNTIKRNNKGTKLTQSQNSSINHYQSKTSTTCTWLFEYVTAFSGLSLSYERRGSEGEAAVTPMDSRPLIGSWKPLLSTIGWGGVCVNEGEKAGVLVLLYRLDGSCVYKRACYSILCLNSSFTLFPSFYRIFFSLLPNLCF